jgi:hypothetical protein
MRAAEQQKIAVWDLPRAANYSVLFPVAFPANLSKPVAQRLEHRASPFTRLGQNVQKIIEHGPRFN